VIEVKGRNNTIITGEPKEYIEIRGHIKIKENIHVIIKDISITKHKNRTNLIIWIIYNSGILIVNNPILQDNSGDYVEQFTTLES
jgi:hypothetical protein